MRKPLSNLIQSVAKIKYKDLEIYLARIKSEVLDTLPLPEEKGEEDKKIKQLCDIDPVRAVLESWNQVEQTIYHKLKKLLPSNSIQYKRLTPDRAYFELLLTGVLPPSAEKLLQELYFLKNHLKHNSDLPISSKSALEYYDLTRRIIRQIDAISELPSVKLTALTLMILEINHLIDTGRYDNISIDEIKKEIEKGTVLQYLQEKAQEDIDLSIILN
ncbi:MAG: hypothetical protein DRN81_04780, partial [Thermoproteota archaeon]